MDGMAALGMTKKAHIFHRMWARMRMHAWSEPRCGTADATGSSCMTLSLAQSIMVLVPLKIRLMIECKAGRGREGRVDWKLAVKQIRWGSRGGGGCSQHLLRLVLCDIILRLHLVK